ncbi:MFS transporter [Parahaliea maris]|uniref:MFS transporter n=1 Tax=Parahaliea maris TaxID=2716870 RepID=UPI00164F3DB1|nr:MFS transporter [Parahaliea maris]
MRSTSNDNSKQPGDGGRDPQPRVSAFSEPGFRRYFFTSCQSNMGTWISRFLLGWSAWELTQSALWVGITSALMLLPTFVLSPLFGVISDRVSPRSGLLCTIGSQGLLGALAAVSILLGWFSIEWLLLLALGIGAISAAHHPMRLALLPRLVSRETLPGAIGITAVVFNVSRILGPAAAGWLLAHTSLSLAFAIAACLFAGACLPLLAIRGIEAPEHRSQGAMLAQLAAGMRYARAHDTIRLALLLTLVNGLLGRTVLELLPALSGKLLDGSATSLAVLTGSAGAGSVIGGLLLARQHGGEEALQRLIKACLLGSSLVLLPAAWLSSLATTAIVVGALSLLTTMTGTCSQALAQLAVDEGFRGRVLSLWTVFAMGGPAVGSLVMGAAADLWGIAPAIITAALMALVATAALSRNAS